MIKIENSVVINRPIEDVFAFTTDIEKRTQWMGELQESKKTSEGPLGVGTTFTSVVGFLGRRIETTMEVTEYEPNRKLGFKSTSGPIPSEVALTFESIEGGTKVTIALQGEVGGFFKVAEPIAARMFKRQRAADMNNLKDLLEAQA